MPLPDGKRPRSAARFFVPAGTLYRLFVGERVDIQQSTNHLLVLRMMLLRLLLEELNAFLAQGNCHFYRVFLEYELLWSRQEIRHNL